MISSLRTRLLVGTIGGIVLLLVCFSLVVYGVIRRALLNEFNESLASTAEILAAGVEADANGIDADFEVEQMPQFNDPEHPALYQVWERTGGVVARSPLLGEADLPRFSGDPGVFTHRTVRDPRTGRSLRAVGVEFSPRIEEDPADTRTGTSQRRALVMVVARDADTLLRHLSSLKWLLLIATGGTAGLALLVGGIVVHRGLHPLQSLAAEIATIDENSLEARIGNEPAPAEIVPIQDRLNHLLVRLKEAFERERRFSANVAHELRNPLAGVRSTVEVTLARERDAAEYRQAFSECLRIVDDMQTMVNNLLLLARMDADQAVLHAEEIPLFDLVEATWGPFSRKASERGLTFENRIRKNVTFPCDRQSLLVIFSNLFSNAVEYTEPGGRVWAQAQPAQGTIEIAVANTGCRLTADQMAKVFDRFWRADAARSDAGTHCGLGLSLVHRLVLALGGSVAATVEADTFTIHIKLPSDVPESPEPGSDNRE